MTNKLKKIFHIDKFKVGAYQRPLIVAEMSGNHDQSIERALKIVDLAAECGADAIKLQTLSPNKITLNSERSEFLIKDKSSPWYGMKLYDLYTRTQTPLSWHKKIQQRAKKRGLIFFSSPFDEDAVDFLEDLNVPVYKLASFENTHLPLIKKIARTGKPLIISTGMATMSEIKTSVNTARDNGCTKIILLKCTSSYPSSVKESNINGITKLQKQFECPVGLSDHTLGIGAAIASIPLGSALIEKHLTITSGDEGIDSSFSLDHKTFKHLVEESKNAWESLGSYEIKPTKSEKISKKFRRSIYTKEDIQKGEKFTSNNLIVVRPNVGLEPSYFEKIIGTTSKKNLKKGTPLLMKHLK